MYIYYIPFSLLDERFLKLLNLRFFFIQNWNNVNAEILSEMGLKTETENDRLTKCPENVGLERHLDRVLHVYAVGEKDRVGVRPFLKKR